MYLRKIDDILTKPYSLWLISIITAFGLWIYVIGGQIEEEEMKSITIQCEINYINVPQHLELTNKVEKVWVYVSGHENDIDNFIIEKNLICEVDTQGLTAGRYRLPVSVTVPKNIKFRETRPSLIEVNLIRFVDILVDVEVVLPQDFPIGFYLESVEIVPKQVTIRGLENDIARIGRIKISPTMEELRSGKELLLPPEIESSLPFEEKIKLEPQHVKLKALLVSGNPRRMVPVRARISGSPNDDYVVISTTIDPAEVLVEGPKANLDRLLSIETDTVDITDIKESASMAVKIKPPQDESMKVLGDRTVKVSINLQPILAIKEIVSIPVKIEGGGQTNWKAVPPTVTVTIEGLPSDINSPAASSLDITAYVNVENLFARQAFLPVRTRIDSDLFRVTRVNPFTISVSSEP